ncbi:DUF1778 domain-containing protein [Vibrio breoganii]|uniref:type II toxin -antitoxin system TacA 1-like antitoxin n=1 Tax=Vibrio breoganii TaxID=553239 RepID=UPI000C82F603|nr:DUF1778 domain-containing protein [Vibrio breoganii]PML85188.1 hypothetical protein BCT68_07590 [Vibrio breoganii]
MNKKRVAEQEVLKGSTASGAYAEGLSVVEVQEWVAMLEQSEPMLLSEEDYNRLMDALELPPKRNETLKKAFKI